MPQTTRALGAVLLLVSGTPGLAWAQARPPEPFVEPDVMPYECVSFGRWLARDSTRVYEREGDTEEVAFTLVPGDSFTAETGNMHVVRAGIVRLLRPVEEEWSGIRLAPGDTLYVLYDGPEGYDRVWYRGRLGAVQVRWAPAGDSDTTASWVAGIVIEPWQSEWWVRIRRDGGRVGWLNMEEALEIDTGCGCC